jgi:hypothetical protein
MALPAPDSSPAIIAAILSLLLAGACVLVHMAMEKKRLGAKRERIRSMADEVTAAGGHLLAQAPGVKETIASLRSVMERQGEAGLMREEQLLEDLIARARVVVATASALGCPQAVESLDRSELDRRLQELQVDARRIRGIRDTFEAKFWVLKRSEQAIRRTVKLRPASLRA